MTMRSFSLFLAALLLSCNAWSQCAPGVPGAGNPGCIPPSQPNSPYYQADAGNPITPPPGSTWKDRWGSVAIDASAGVPGAIVGRESEDVAEKTALDICQKNGGSHCKVLITFHNQCAAIAQSSKGGSLFGSSAYPKEQAEARALKQCNDATCQVLFSDCSLPQQVQ